jgi:hypothetical protein
MTFEVEKMTRRRFFSASALVFFVSIIPPVLLTSIRLPAALNQKYIGRSLGTFKEAKLFRKSVGIG